MSAGVISHPERQLEQWSCDCLPGMLRLSLCLSYLPPVWEDSDLLGSLFTHLFWRNYSGQYCRVSKTYAAYSRIMKLRIVSYDKRYCGIGQAATKRFGYH